MCSIGETPDLAGTHRARGRTVPGMRRRGVAQVCSAAMPGGDGPAGELILAVDVVAASNLLLRRSAAVAGCRARRDRRGANPRPGIPGSVSASALSAAREY